MLLSIIVSIRCTRKKHNNNKSERFQNKVVHAQHYQRSCTDEFKHRARKRNSIILCSIQYKSPSPFLSLGYVFIMFLNLGHFSALCSYKKNSVYIVKEEYVKAYVYICYYLQFADENSANRCYTVYWNNFSSTD